MSVEGTSGKENEGDGEGGGGIRVLQGQMHEEDRLGRSDSI